MVKICNGWHDVLFMVMFACYLMMCDAKMPRLRNRSLGIGLTWPQMQQRSTPSSRKGLSTCCSCRTAAGDTNCCRRTLLSLRGRQELRYCRILCVRKAGSPCSQCVPSRHQATLSRLCGRLCLQGSSKAFLVTSFPSMYCVGLSRNAAYAWRRVMGLILFLWSLVLVELLPMCLPRPALALVI